ncbi:L-aspartate oxidase [Ruminococcus sp. XPD3002]|uniref:L-aspartate oxidase n=1 Tax=Ruminococcus sp. XPD3002 TaxID=1452269 RepID=UPI00091438D4|nr:FAD-binding protein [Ruminococcus sp.]SFY04947.1 L-aspartate oxidase [Ruminococcus flavefaciens]
MSVNYDVIIAGCGAAGLYAAINLPSELNILILCKRELSLCNSSLAQGGIAGVYNSPNDNIQYHQNDTLIAGSFKNNVDAVHTLVSEAAQDIEHIIDLGVEFDKKPDGTYHRTLEGGHSHHRIFHHADATGKEITTTLLENVQKLPNVTIMENTMMCSVKKTSTGYSALLKDIEENYTTANCHFMILATGGIGRVYQFTTNSAIATGDGITFAFEMGAKIKNLSYVQFHPTAFNNRATRECFLISEAVRGEGAYLLNCHKERFMHNYDERLELAPRDVVSHAIILESRKQNSTDFYLDISYKDSEFLKNRFPMIYKNLLDQGYDLTKEPVPIFPCQHYLMGGIDVDRNSETSLPNLYACGECSHTGVHGSNRLASNSLLEALVFSRHAANDIASKAASAPKDFEEAEFDPHIGAPHIPKGVRTETRKIMQNSYFVIPDKKAAAEGFKRVKEIREDLLSGGYLVDADYVLAKSIVTVAYIILSEVME